MESKTILTILKSGIPISLASKFRLSKRPNFDSTLILRKLEIVESNSVHLPYAFGIVPLFGIKSSCLSCQAKQFLAAGTKAVSLSQVQEVIVMQRRSYLKFRRWENQSLIAW